MQSPPRSIEHVHRTVAGRVVYNRPIHFFTERDLGRIAGAVIAATPTDRGLLYELLKKINLFMLDRILGLVGLSEWKEIVLDFILDLVGRTLSNVRNLFGHSVSGAMAAQINSTLLSYLPEKPGKPTDFV